MSIVVASERIEGQAGGPAAPTGGRWPGGPAGGRSGRSLRGLAARVAAAVVALVLLGTAVDVLRTALGDTRTEAGAIVVLGAAQRDGWPRPVLEARLEHALSLYEAGYAPTVVTTGGVGRDRTTSEAEAGAAWLVAQGVPEDAVVAVPEGGDTVSSLAAVADVERKAPWSSVLLVSDPQHLHRSVAMAGHVGLDVAGASPARGGPNADGSPVRFGYFVARETLAYLSWRGELVAGTAVDGVRGVVAAAPPTITDALRGLVRDVL